MKERNCKRAYQLTRILKELNNVFKICMNKISKFRVGIWKKKIIKARGLLKNRLSTSK